MSDINITIESGKSKRLKTAGKLCKDNIVVKALGGGGGGAAVPILQEKTITQNGNYTPETGYDGFSKVSVDVPIPAGYVKPDGTTNISKNGLHNVGGFLYAQVSVPNEIDPLLQEKAVTITENGTVEITPDSGYGGLGKAVVTVNVPTEGGTCSGNHIIEVDTLPTENIDDNAVYKCGDAFYKHNDFVDVVVTASVDSIFYHVSLNQLFHEETAEHSFNKYPKQITEAKCSDLENGVIHFYYDDIGNEIGTVSEGADGNRLFVPLQDTIDVNFNGAIYDVSEATSEGYYAVIAEWGKYTIPVGMKKIDTNGTYNVVDFSEVVVDTPDAAVVGAWKFNDIFHDNFPINDFFAIYTVPINFTTVIGGETKQCTGIKLNFDDGISRYIYYLIDGTMVQVASSTPTYPYWSYESAKTVDFGTDPQIVPSAFKTWLTTNATPLYKIVRTDV